MVTNVVNVVGASCKRRDALFKRHVVHIAQALKVGELTNENRFNRETTLTRLGDTHWSSHCGTLISLITMFESFVDVLDNIVYDDLNSKQRVEVST